MRIFYMSVINTAMLSKVVNIVTMSSGRKNYENNLKRKNPLLPFHATLQQSSKIL